MDACGLYIGKIHIEKDDFEEHLEKFRHTLKLAQILECKNIRLFSFYMPEGENPDKYMEEVVRRLNIFIEIAKESQVTLCHENEKGIFGDNAERCLELHKRLPELRGVFDPANFIQCDQDTMEAWN